MGVWSATCARKKLEQWRPKHFFVLKIFICEIEVVFLILFIPFSTAVVFPLSPVASCHHECFFSLTGAGDQFYFFPLSLSSFRMWETECFFPTPPPPHPRWYGRKQHLVNAKTPR